MMEFIMCVIQYVLIAVALAGIAGVGLFLGAKASTSKAKKAAATTEEQKS